MSVGDPTAAQQGQGECVFVLLLLLVKMLLMKMLLSKMLLMQMMLFCRILKLLILLRVWRCCLASKKPSRSREAER